MLFLTFDKAEGLVGGTTDAEQSKTGASEITSFQFGAGTGVSKESGGLKASVVSLSDVTLSKSFDAMSPPLFAACSRGAKLPKASVIFAKPNADATSGAIPYLTILMENAVISGVSWSSGGEMPSESISLTYEKITFTYEAPPTTAKEGQGKPVVTGWDAMKNVKI
jgi:type VI secretion system secreted protein Hcp